MTTYDPRYLAGVLFFNAHDFFEAHEAWEALWMESTGSERKFVQGLIQAAVALFHYNRGNFAGALKLFRSSRDYMKPCGSPYLGLDSDAFWLRMEECFRTLLETPAPERTLRPDEALIPVITLTPPPETWPNPEDYIPEDEEE